MQTTENSAHAKIAGGLILKRMMVKTAESAAPPPSKKLWCRSAVLWFQRSKSPFLGLRTNNFDENVIEPPKIAAELGKGQPLQGRDASFPSYTLCLWRCRKIVVLVYFCAQLAMTAW